MANFYITKDMIKGDMAFITGEEANHISKVLRMKTNDKVTLCDGEGCFYDAELTEFTKTSVSAKILSQRMTDTEPKVRITLYQGIPKNPKMETIVQKATEIGVVRIVPVNTKRIVAKLDKKEKLERLRKIALEAAKQSKRGIVPIIEDTMDFKDAVIMAKESELSIIPYEEETKISVKDILTKTSAKSISIFIGPEGGFEKSEIGYAVENNIIPVTLGKRILRTETAGIVVSAITLYEFGEMQ